MAGVGEDTSTPESPPVSQWPGIIGKAFTRATLPYGYGDYVQSMGMAGEKPMLPSEYFGAAGPPDPQYGGALGLGQRLATTVGGPTAPLMTLGPGMAAATVGGDLFAQGAQDYLHAGPLGQAIAGGVGGLGAGAAFEAGASRAAASAASAAAARQATAHLDVASTLFKGAGVETPISPAIADVKHEVGKVVQSEVGEVISRRASAADASADAMKAAAKKTARSKGAKTPVPDPSDTYLDGIEKAGTPGEAVDAATSDPTLFRSLPPKAQTAIGGMYAHQAEANPSGWLGLDPSYQEKLIPDRMQRAAVTAAAQRAAARVTATPTGPAESPNLLQQLKSMAMRAIGNRAIHGLTGSYLGSHVGNFLDIPAPLGELAGAGIGAIAKPLVRSAATPTGMANLLTGAGQGYESSTRLPVQSTP